MRSWAEAVGVSGMIVLSIIFLSIGLFARGQGLKIDWWSRSLGAERRHLRILESVASLRRYIEGMLAVTDVVELYACWEGDWEEACESRREVTPDHFGGDAFDLTQRQLLIVRAELSCKA